MRGLARLIQLATRAGVQVVCPVCGALVDDVCVVHDVPLLWPHEERLWAAWRLTRDERRAA